MIKFDKIKIKQRKRNVNLIALIKIKLNEFLTNHQEGFVGKRLYWLSGMGSETEWKQRNKLRVLLLSIFIILCILIGAIPSIGLKIIMAVILLMAAILSSYKVEEHIKLNRQILIETDPLRDGLKELLKAAEHVTKSGFGQKIDIKSEDEIGQLAQSFNFLLHNVGNFIKDLDQISVESSGTSRQLEDITFRTSHVMQDVSATLQELSSTTQNLNSNLEEIAEGAKNVDDLTHEGLNKLSNLEDKMGQMITISDKASERIKLLSESSEKMKGFIAVISKIARQTNLLALNASIEAARAGDAGKGFAVVAEEVGKLAANTQTALTDINKLIDNFRKETLQTINLIQENNTEIYKGETTLKETSKMFNVIASHISNIVEVIEKSADASSQIAKGSHEIASSTQVQTASISEISQLSEQLSLMSKALKEKLSNSSISSNNIAFDIKAFDLEYQAITKDQTDVIKENLGIKGKFVVGLIARLEPVKGVHFFVEGMKEIVTKNKDVVAIIVGAGSLSQELVAKVKAEALEENILFLGYRNDIPLMLSIIDLVVSTSEKEGVPPMTLMEALAASKPIVATEVNGNQQLIKNNVNGILVEYNNVHKLVYSIEKFINQPALKMVFGNEGRKHIEELAGK
ncbi:MAG: glycosyltransferase [Vallitaleaceae bacterium]|nr:glycosyltransferase [Vallitaleaceae bacterium]